MTRDIEWAIRVHHGMITAMHDVVRALNEQAGCDLELVGIVEQGQSGAAYVRWPDGRDSVVTTALTSIERMRQTADILAEVRARGIPVPLHEFLYQLDGTVAVVQERLPGATVVEAGIDTVDAIIALNERFAGLLRDHPEVPVPQLNLGRPDDSVSSAPLETHSPRSRRILQLIREIRPVEICGDDLVHTDLTVPNTLFDPAGRITGLVDWNYGVARGDRNYGLVKLLHTLSTAAALPDADYRPTREAVQRVEEYVEGHVDPDAARRWWANHTLGMLYWNIRGGNETAVEIFLTLGERRLA